MHAGNGGLERWANPNTLRTAAHVVIVLAGSWWLLGQLATVLRPLLLAVFLGYVLLPYYSRLRLYVPVPVALGVLVGATTGLLLLIAFGMYVSLSGLSVELPMLRPRAVGLVHDVANFLHEYLPGATGSVASGTRSAEEQAADKISENVMWLANLAALGFLEAASAGLYLMFLLMESGKFPDRVRAAYPPEKADEILHVFGRINAAVIRYLKAKVLSSLLLAVPVGAILWACGVKFSLLWALLTFACNFIPYLGSVIAYTLPIGFAFLQFEEPGRPIWVAALLTVCHVLGAAVVEPMILGKAVGLSPLVVLGALSLWGLSLGLPGMFLAVPLTVVVVLVLDNIEATRPIAKLLGG